MNIHATLTVDLNGSVTTYARDQFYESLRKRNFFKNNLTTTWTVEFKEGCSIQDAQNYVKDSVDIASQASGIKNYEAGAMYGIAPLVQWRSPTASFLGY